LKIEVLPRSGMVNEKRLPLGLPWSRMSGSTVYVGPKTLLSATPSTSTKSMRNYMRRKIEVANHTQA